MEAIKKKSPVKKNISKPKHKAFDIEKYFGKITWNEEPVKFQRSLRDDK